MNDSNMLDIVILIASATGAVMSYGFAKETTGIWKTIWISVFSITMTIFLISVIGGIVYYG